MQDCLAPSLRSLLRPAPLKGVYLICDNQDAVSPRLSAWPCLTSAPPPCFPPEICPPIPNTASCSSGIRRTSSYMATAATGGCRTGSTKFPSGGRRVLDPRRDDKEDVLVRDIDLLEGLLSVHSHGSPRLIDKLKVGIVHGVAAPRAAASEFHFRVCAISMKSRSTSSSAAMTRSVKCSRSRANPASSR